VEDDAVAAAGIELLKQKRAGRATFPSTKLSHTQHSPTIALRYADGFIDYAINLIDCDRCYRDVFAYFGSTVILKP